jgi:hypothetical protein
MGLGITLATSHGCGCPLVSSRTEHDTKPAACLFDAELHFMNQPAIAAGHAVIMITLAMQGANPFSPAVLCLDLSRIFALIHAAPRSACPSLHCHIHAYLWPTF